MMVMGMMAQQRMISLGSEHWLLALGTAGTDQPTVATLAVDESGNIYCGGQTDPLGTNQNGQLVKLSPNGDVLWQRWYGDANTDSINGCVVNSDGRLFICGVSNNMGVVAELDPATGFQLWARFITTTTTNLTGIVAIGTTALIVSGHTTASGGRGIDDAYLVKLTVAGGVTYQRSFGTSSSDRGWGVARGGSGTREYVVGNGTGGAYNSGIIGAFDGAGTFQWARQLYDTTGNTYFWGCTADASDNLYLVGSTSTTTTGGVSAAVVAKFNSSGTSVWEKRIGNAFVNAAYSVSLLDGQLYVAGLARPDAGTNNNALFFCMDTDGNMVWQRSIEAGGNEVGRAIVPTSDKLVLSFYSNAVGAGAADFVVGRFPKAALPIGTYGPYTISDPSLTVNDSTIPTITAPASNTRTLTNTTAVLTNSASGLSASKTTVP